MPESTTIDVRIGALGAQGDGIATIGDDRVYVPYTVPGDLVRVLPGEKRGEGVSATVIDLMEPGPGRQDAACVHFGVCGGCALQHLSEGLYAEFKQDQVTRALAHHGLGDVPVAAPLVAPAGARRRTRLTARKAGERVLLGYLERGSHRMVDVAACPVIVPALERLLSPLRNLLASLLGAKDVFHIVLTATTTGIDMMVTAERRPNLRGLQRLSEFAEAQDLARLTWESKDGPELIAMRRQPIVDFASVGVPVPPGAFLQATQESEAWMIALAREATSKARRIADLFAGCGTFTAGLADRAAISAFESSAEMIEACRRGLNRATGLHPVTLARRDLFREPLTIKELKPFDAVVIDPPRAGAKAQMETLAASGVKVIAAFSCNPATFARDARMLVDGGYRLEQVTPIDQFRWSAHVELAAVFLRT